MKQARRGKSIRHYHEPGHLHEFTFSCYQLLPLLTNDDWRRKLSRYIDAANECCRWQLVAFVFMPEHVHLLTDPLDDEPDIGAYLQVVKEPFSKAIHKGLVERQSNLLKKLVIRDRPGRECFRFWQEGAGYDRNLWTKQAIRSSIDYIHQNPVRRGLCLKATEWKWSSARWYCNEPPRQQDPDLPHIHGLRSEL